MKIKIPYKSEKQLSEYFRDKNLGLIVDEYKKESKNLHHGTKIYKRIKAYPPRLDNLFLVNYIIEKYKRVTCLEFGTGWSSLVISHALLKNKQKYSKQIKNLRFSNPFELHVVDSQKKFIEISKKRIKNDSIKSKFYNSPIVACNWNGVICNEYKKLPNVNPDFIYLDGPDHKDIKGSINNISPSYNDFMPLNCDLLKIEYYLTPGTIILIDGRSANAKFLKLNFNRNWSHTYDKLREHHIFYLNDDPLGKHNKKQLKFYKNKIIS